VRGRDVLLTARAAMLIASKRAMMPPADIVADLHEDSIMGFDVQRIVNEICSSICIGPGFVSLIQSG
jgi:predicted deacylase